MKLIRPMVILAVTLFAFSCKQDSGRMTKDQATMQQQEPQPGATVAAANELNQYLQGKPAADNKQDSPEENDKKKQPRQPIARENPDWEKKIIKQASVNIEIKDYAHYYNSLREKVRGVGGYVAQEEQKQDDFKIENTMVIKVPVEQFDNALALLTDKVERINERKISSQDVTSEVIDTKSRIEAKKHVRQRYMDLLGQARNMEDILSVQSEINGVQEEIESATGRVEYLSHASQFSTINLTYYQVLDASAPKDNGDPVFGERIKYAFRAGLDIVGNLLVVIITVWPLILVSFFAYLLFRKWRSSNPKQA